jgi:hypothetical protein
MDDVLIDVFVGRHPDDLRYLDMHYSKGAHGMSLASAITNLTSSNELRAALKICTEGSRDDPARTVDTAVVNRDVQKIIELLKLTFMPHQPLFEILLRRSDPHIAQVNLFFQMNTGMHLDEAIRRHTTMAKMTSKIAVHAVRTASDMIYRDVMLLRDSMIVSSGKDEKIAIRVCRMHWHKLHWKQIKAVYVGHCGKDFVDKFSKGKKCLFRDLIISMAST